MSTYLVGNPKFKAVFLARTDCLYRPFWTLPFWKEPVVLYGRLVRLILEAQMNAYELLFLRRLNNDLIYCIVKYTYSQYTHIHSMT